MWRVILISIIINATRPRVLSTGSVRISMRRSSEQNRFRWKLFFFIIIISLLSHTTWKFMPKRPDGARKKKKMQPRKGEKNVFDTVARGNATCCPGGRRGAAPPSTGSRTHQTQTRCVRRVARSPTKHANRREYYCVVCGRERSRLILITTEKPKRKKERQEKQKSVFIAKSRDARRNKKTPAPIRKLFGQKQILISVRKASHEVNAVSCFCRGSKPQYRSRANKNNEKRPPASRCR